MGILGLVNITLTKSTINESQSNPTILRNLCSAFHHINRAIYRFLLLLTQALSFLYELLCMLCYCWRAFMQASRTAAQQAPSTARILAIGLQFMMVPSVRSSIWLVRGAIRFSAALSCACKVANKISWVVVRQLQQVVTQQLQHALHVLIMLTCAAQSMHRLLVLPKAMMRILGQAAKMQYAMICDSIGVVQQVVKVSCQLVQAVVDGPLKNLKNLGLGQAGLGLNLGLPVCVSKHAQLLLSSPQAILLAASCVRRAQDTARQYLPSLHARLAMLQPGRAGGAGGLHHYTKLHIPRQL